jgi:hypothetical protein
MVRLVWGDERINKNEIWRPGVNDIKGRAEGIDEDDVCVDAPAESPAKSHQGSGISMKRNNQRLRPSVLFHRGMWSAMVERPRAHSG